MDTESLRLFVEVSRRLSFAAVAAERGIDPSVVSRTIAQLEGRLGVRLFHRTTRRMRATEAGLRFLARVVPLLEDLDAACEMVRDGAASPAGTVRLTCSVALAERLIVPALSTVRQDWPGLGFELIATDARLDLVAEGIDLAIRHGPGRPEGGIAARLFDTRYRVVASPAYLAAHGTPRAPEDLAAHKCVLSTLPAFRTAWRFRGLDGRELSVAVAGPVAVSAPLAQRRAALEGLGPALLADWLIGDDLAAGRLVDLFPDLAVAATAFETAVWLLYPERRLLPAKTRAAIDALRRVLAATPAR